MKLVVKALCIILLLISCVWAQALTAYERRVTDLTLEFIREFGTYSNYSRLASMPNNQHKKVAVGEHFALLALESMAQAMAGGANRIMLLNRKTAQLKRDIEAARSLMSPAERAAEAKRAREEAAEKRREEAEKKRQEQERERNNTFLYAVIFSKAKEYFSERAPVRGQFETTDEFKKRVDAFYKDSTGIHIDNIINWALGRIVDQVQETWLEELDLKNYNADQATWRVRGAVPGKRASGRGAFNIGVWTEYAVMKILPQEARVLSERGYFTRFDPADVYHVDYVMFPTKMTIISKADTTKQYVVNFPRRKDAQEIVFRTRELWPDNPLLKILPEKYLTVNYKDVAGMFLVAKQEEAAGQARIAAEQRRIQDSIAAIQRAERAEQARIQARMQEFEQMREEWYERIERAKGWDLLFRTADGKIVKFQERKPFPIPEGTYEIYGKKVTFKKKGRDIVCSINGIDVYAWVVGSGNKVSSRYYNLNYNGNYLFILGFGIFDVDANKFPPLITSVQQTPAAPPPAAVQEQQAAQQRIQDSIAAEQTRIAQEQRIAAERQWAQDSIAAEQQRVQAEQARIAEQQRVAAEQQRTQDSIAAEQQRIQAERQQRMQDSIQAEQASVATAQAAPPPASSPIIETVIDTTQQTTTETAPNVVQETAAPQPTTPAADKDRDNHFVFSLRPEFVAGTAIAGVGLNMELGAIIGDGLYISGDLGGGAIYFGGGFNIGYCINKDGNVKNALGATAGALLLLRPVEFIVQPSFGFPSFGVKEYGVNTSFGGVFHKLMIGNQNNFDITNRLMLGHRKNPVDYISRNNIFIYESGVNLTWSLGVGYTLTKKR